MSHRTIFYSGTLVGQKVKKGRAKLRPKLGKNHSEMKTSHEEWKIFSNSIVFIEKIKCFSYYVIKTVTCRTE